MSSGLAVAVPVQVVVWRVVPARTPHVLRACPRCGPMPFASSDRFRVNASGRRLDVWLVYRCTGCDHTWNLTVRERATPEAIGAALLEAYHRNDAAEAWRCAFDAGLLGRAGARLEAATPVRVERGPAPDGPFAIRFELPWPVRVRLDRLLAAELGIPRAVVRARCTAGELDGPVREGAIVTVSRGDGRGAP
jgi:hypothetical protein